VCGGGKGTCKERDLEKETLELVKRRMITDHMKRNRNRRPDWRIGLECGSGGGVVIYIVTS
jgi:hypothetical protein